MKRTAKSSFLLPLALLLFGALPARGEGSRELVQNGGTRPWLEVRDNSFIAAFQRKTIIQVSVDEGDWINLGSSSIGVGDGNIIARDPNGTQAVDCDVDQPGTGSIDTLNHESNGPGTGTDGTTGVGDGSGATDLYQPCLIQVGTGQGGIWEVEFTPPGTSTRPGAIAANAQWPAPGADDFLTAAWDVTVRTDDNNTQEQTGRVFTDLLALNMSRQGEQLNSDLYILTQDGFIYLTDLNQMDPFGFVFLANDKGLLDTDGTPLYRSSTGVQDVSNVPTPLANGITVQDPVHRIFFNEPSIDLNTLPTPILITPTNPAVSNASFIGTVENTTPISVGGTFQFNSTVAGSYQIVIRDSNNNIVRLLQDTVNSGVNTVPWDGTDENGTALPPGEYDFEITVRAGEYHFPLLDVENNPLGLTFTLLNAPGAFRAGTDVNTAFYNDEDYTTADGTFVDMPNTGTPPDPIATDPVVGTGTGSSNYHAFGDATGNQFGFGDRLAVDTWVYFTSQPVMSTLVIIDPNVVLDSTKAVALQNDLNNNGLPDPGDTLRYTITVTNSGTADALSVNLNDTPDANTTLVVGSVTPPGGSTVNSGNNTGDTDVDVEIGTVSGNNGTASVTFDVIINDPLPNDTTQIANQGTVSSSNFSPVPTDDPSTSNNPDDPTVLPIEVPRLGVAKAAGEPVANPDGTFTIPYSIQVENLGNVALNNLQIEEDLTTTFAGTTAFTVESSSLNSPDLTVNSNFNGQGNNQLLAAGNSLSVGATATINFEVTVTPGTNFGPYNNTAAGSASSPEGRTVTDDSTDGNDVDPDGDGNPDENDPTVVNLVVPRLGVAKAAGTPVNNGDGTFTIPYTIQVENLGNVPLSNLQVTEDLTTTFSGVSSFSVVSNSIGSPSGLVVNSNFNGQGNNDLLATGNTLAIGETETIEFEVTVTPGTNFGPYENTATGSGSGPDGTEVTDDSTDGNDADPDGDGTPDENDPTTVTLSSQPLLGVAKAAGTPVNNGDGTFTIPYTIQVDNLGNVAVEDLQVVENLANTFSGVSSFTVVSNSLTSPSGLVVNSNFNGQGNNNLLATGNTLAVGATATISFEVTVTPGTNFGPYNNTATASGTGPDGTPVEDDSTDGNDVDPDGDGTPDEDVPTTVSLLAPPDGRANLRLVKRVTAINDRTFIDIVDDPNLDDNAPSWPGNYLQGRIDVPDVFPGDEVEYTIYFMSDGEVSANNVRICDLVPLNQTFVPNGFNGLAQAGGGFGGVNRGVAIAFGLNAPLSYTNANDGDIARFFTQGNFVPVPPGGAAPQPCPAVNNSANGNGAIVIELGDLPSVADDPQRAFGFIRFRATVD